MTFGYQFVVKDDCSHNNNYFCSTEVQNRRQTQWKLKTMRLITPVSQK